MTHQFQNEPDLADQQIDELLDDIEIRCTADVAAARELNAVRAKIGVTIRPGNTSDRSTLIATGDTVEIKSQGVACVTDHPAGVGDVFHLTFERGSCDLAPILAVCDRCTMLAEASFESRFKFVHEIVLPKAPDK